MVVKPISLEVDADAIPDELKALPRWHVWFPELREREDGTMKWDKRPVVSTKDPSLWLSFDKALASMNQRNAGGGGKKYGIGFLMVDGDGLIGIDLDGCLDEKGRPSKLAQHIMEATGYGYCEISPGGRGLRLFVKGKLPNSDWTNHDEGIEVYGGSSGRFLTITGNVFLFPEGIPTVDTGTLALLEAKYRKAAGGARTVVDQDLELLDGIEVPVHVHPWVRDFLATGAHQGDRSGSLQFAAQSLAACGLSAAEVYSVLANNEHAMAVALDHRGQDSERALEYFRVHHVLPAIAGRGAVIEESDFEDVSSTDAPKLPALVRDKKGAIEATIDNATKACACPSMVGGEIRWDDFRDEVVIAEHPGEWRQFRDADYARLRIRLERKGFKPVGRELIRDAVGLVADDHRFDTAIYWLENLPAWDGNPRIAAFFPTYFQTKDTEYTRAVGRYIWSAMAGRVLSPGIKADMVPVLIGDQGMKKSWAISTMVPHEEFFAEIDIDERREDNNSRKMRGTLIAELAELKGLKTRDAEYTKAFITRTHEEWTPKFKEFAHKFARRLVFIGTTNEDQFLADTTGNRRWLPMRVGEVHVEGIRRDRDQLWAEARELFKREGVVFRDAERLGAGVHADHMIRDEWEETIARWLDTPVPTDVLAEPAPDAPKHRDDDCLTTMKIAEAALHIEKRNLDKRVTNRIAAVMRSLGWVSATPWVGRKKVRAWRFGTQE